MTGKSPATTGKPEAPASEDLQAADIIRAAGDLFAQSTEHDSRACRKFEELASNLLAHVAVRERRRFAARLCRHPQLPRAVAMLLAGDVIAVAAPVLASSPVFSPRDLCRLAIELGADHRLAIAARRELPPRLVSRLIGGGDNRLLMALARRHDVRLDDHLQSAFLRAGKKNQVLAGLLVRRPDIPITRRAGLFLALDSENRLTLLADLEREVLRNAARRQSGSPESAGQDNPANSLFARVVSGDLQGAAADLSRATRAPQALISRMLLDPGGEPLAVVLLAADLSVDEAIAVSLHAHPQIGRSVDRMRGLTRLIEQMSPAAARMVLAAMADSAGEARAGKSPDSLLPGPPARQSRLRGDTGTDRTASRRLRAKARGSRSGLQSR